MYIDVILPLSLTTSTLTYQCDYDVEVGCRVLILIGRQTTRTVTGIVLATDVEPDESLKLKIRPVLEVLDRIPLIPSVTLDFWVWISQYYMANLGNVVRTQMAPILSGTYFFRSALRQMSSRVRPSVRLPNALPFDLPVDKSATLIIEHSPLAIESLVEEILDNRSLVDDGMILILTPNPHQVKTITQNLLKWWTAESYTTSMKIERRGDLYARLAMGINPLIVVGTRTALSLPVKKWDAIIVLDAHSNAYKSDHQPLLWARDAALYLASLHKASCYMVTPTPGVEMYHNAMQNDWGIVHTPAVDDDGLQNIVLERGRDLISTYLRVKIKGAIDNGYKAIVFQNRRGYSSWVECISCGHIPYCEKCNTSLTYHNTRNRLQCHHCSYTTPFNWQCPKCSNKMEFYGRGTERLQEQLQSLFPNANIIRVDSDSVNPTSFRIDPDWDIMVGTQMVLDSRVNFKDVAVLGIANVDNIVSASDFRNNESRYQLIRAISAKCHTVGAELVIQSSRVDDPVIKAALESDFISIYNTEITDRQTHLYPPFARLIQIELRSRLESVAFNAGRELEDCLRPIFGERLSPLFQPIVNKLSGEHIVKLLLRIERSRSASKAKEILTEQSAPLIRKYRNSATISFDVDPLF